MAAAVLSGAAALTFAGAASASASDVSPASASGKCTNGDLCLFSDSNFNGTKNQWGMPASGTCSDITGFSTANRVSSIDFPAPGAHQAWFYDNGNFVLSLAQNHYLKNLASDTSASGGNANDKIDEVVIC
ncbi:hypothetical protein GCM10027176_27760 [Actinoallomurus bryophytorum]